MSRHFGFVYHDTNGPNHGPVWKTQSFPLERNLYGHPLARTQGGQQALGTSRLAELEMVLLFLRKIAAHQITASDLNTFTITFPKTCE